MKKLNKRIPILEGLAVIASMVLCCITIGHFALHFQASQDLQGHDILLMLGVPSCLLWSGNLYLEAIGEED